MPSLLLTPWRSAASRCADNDILVIDKTFGAETAVEEAQKALLAAKVGPGAAAETLIDRRQGACLLSHSAPLSGYLAGQHSLFRTPLSVLILPQVEASSAYRGVGLVKLMGRQSGFIAVQAGCTQRCFLGLCDPEPVSGALWRPLLCCSRLPHACLSACPAPQSSLASGMVDAVLIPEVPFRMDGENGFLAYIANVLEAKGARGARVGTGPHSPPINQGIARSALGAAFQLAYCRLLPSPPAWHPTQPLSS